ncbi:MAG: fumarylacetoacetate hydrolase family protein [Eubacteriales bacterium]|nr:fumarylacetoacetate hydrolase family protein [Eubacteriales bacterium]MDD3349858.1 fumarylacetoacetate hydrolase family protein [Eubacteriales bacterium]
MMYATILYQEQEQLCCVDSFGERVFLLAEFFSVCQSPEAPSTTEGFPADMLSFISCYQPEWTDEIAEFYGKRPELSIPLSSVELLAPIPRPARNIVCLGKNYKAHAEELKGQIFNDKLPTFPIYFTKPDHTVIATGGTILLHETITQKVDYEVELAIVIGKSGTDIPKEKAEEHIFGYTIANDVSARDLQQDHTQWYKGKSLLTHCPMGPWIAHKSTLPLPLELKIQSAVNGEGRQSANVSELIFDIPTIISDLSRGYMLRPGDIILTGTPAGVGMGFDPPKYLKDGDLVDCQIEKIGVLSNSVAFSCKA